MNEIIAAVIAHGSWRGLLNRADEAKLRLAGYTVRRMSKEPDADGLFDVEVS